MYKEIYKSLNPEKAYKTRIKISKQNLIDLNDYILNFQRYYELIKNNPNLLTSKKPKEIDINNIDNLSKRNPYNKLQNDISTIYKRIYTDNTVEKNANYKMQYLYNNNAQFNPKNSSKKSKVYKSMDKSKEICDINNSNNIQYKNLVERNKIEYGNYAMNSTNFNHPQLYLLKINKSYNMKDKLPGININQGGFKINRTGDLSNLIPQNTKKMKFKNNFYNYYIGLKHSKGIFNI